MDNSNTLAESLRAQGLEVETVGDIIEKGSSAPAPTLAFDPARIGDTPLPDPGIYFAMPEDEYLAAPAFSNSGVKLLAASPMLFWAKTPWLNADFEPPEEKEHYSLGHATDTRILEGKEAFEKRFTLALDKADYPDVLVAVDDIRKRLDEYGLKGKGTKKDDLFGQLLEYDPDAKLWGRMVAEHAEANADRTMISAKQLRHIEIAARLIERDEELSKAISGGYPQVSLFWTCAKTGIPMKARVDYLKTKALIDLKTTANKNGKSIERAIRHDIANYNYNLQPSTYFEAVDQVRKLVKEHGASVIHGDEDQTAWAMKWAANLAPDQFLFIFLQTGVATIARGVWWPRGGTTKMISDEIVSRMKRRFREMSEAYGTLPWLDLSPIIDLSDEDIPPWSLDI